MYFDSLRFIQRSALLFFVWKESWSFLASLTIQMVSLKLEKDELGLYWIELLTVFLGITSKICWIWKRCLCVFFFFFFLAGSQSQSTISKSFQGLRSKVSSKNIVFTVCNSPILIWPNTGFRSSVESLTEASTCGDILQYME